MSRRLVLIACLLLVPGLLPGSAIIRAQDVAGRPVKEAAPDPATEKKALDLLESISDQAMNLRSPLNRIGAECAIADLLWTRDEKRSRSLFKAATQQTIALIAELDYGDQQIYQEISNINQQRQVAVTRIAAHDPALALSFLRETRFAAGATRQPWNYASEQNLELNLARLLLAKDPARSLELARSTLKEGVSWNVVSFLTQLQQKDPAAAKAFFQEMVIRIKDEDLERNQEFVGAAWNLLSAYMPPLADEDTYRDLLNMLVSRALSTTVEQAGPNVAQNMYGQIGNAMPQVEKYAPARATELRQWTRSMERMLDPSSRMYRELSEFSQNGTPDEILALTSKYPTDLHNQIYQNAAWKAFTGGDPARARQIINDLVTDPIQRRQILDQFDNQVVSNAPEENKAIEVHRALPRMKSLDRKVQLLTQAASSLFHKGDRKGALELLDEARGMVEAAPSNSMKYWAQIQLAQHYGSMDSEQAFALMQTVVTRTNELVAAAVVLDGFDYRYLKNGEWLMPGQSGIGGLVTGMDQALTKLVRLDFDRALVLADQIERPEIRFIIDLHLAQSALRRGSDSQLYSQSISFGSIY